MHPASNARTRIRESVFHHSGEERPMWGTSAVLGETLAKLGGQGFPIRDPVRHLFLQHGETASPAVPERFVEAPN